MALDAPRALAALGASIELGHLFQPEVRAVPPTGQQEWHGACAAAEAMDLQIGHMMAGGARKRWRDGCAARAHVWRLLMPQRPSASLIKAASERPFRAAIKGCVLVGKRDEA